MNAEAKLEDVGCPLCQSPNRREAYRFPPFSVVRCEACGFYYLSPRLIEPEMLRVYGDAYFEGEGDGYASYAEQERSLRKTFRRLLSRMRERGLIGGSLLEVGCGYGYFLDEARPFFQLRVGTEYSGPAAAEARPRADRVYAGGVEELAPGERFDCIVAMQVIEHVYNPRTFLERLRGHLNRGGSVIMAAPDMGSFWRRLMGRRWPSFKIPEHIQYFDRRSLSALMSQTGFSVGGTLPYPHAFPVSLVAQKLRIPAPPFLSKASLWLPATTVAVYGTCGRGGESRKMA